MKRTDLIRKLEEAAASSFATEGSTIGIATPRRAFLNRCPDIGRSMNFLQSTF